MILGYKPIKRKYNQIIKSGKYGFRFKQINIDGKNKEEKEINRKIDKLKPLQKNHKEKTQSILTNNFLEKKIDNETKNNSSLLIINKTFEKNQEIIKDKNISVIEFENLTINSEKLIPKSIYEKNLIQEKNQDKNEKKYDESINLNNTKSNINNIEISQIEINKTLIDNSSTNEITSYIKNKLTFQNLAKKIYDFHEISSSYFKFLFNEMGKNDDLKNIIIFGICVFGLVLIIIFKKCFFDSIFNKYKFNNKKPEAKFLLQGRKIKKPEGNKFLLQSKNDDFSSDSETDSISADFMKLHNDSFDIFKKKDENESNLKFGAIFNNSSVDLKKSSKKSEENKNQSNMLLNKFQILEGYKNFSILNPEEIDLNHNNSKNISQKSLNTQFVPKTEDLMVFSDDSENDKMAKKLNYMVKNHLCQETVITKCMVSKEFKCGKN